MLLQELQNGLKATKAHAVQYRDEESGSLIAFSMFIFLAMIIFGGIAVDMMLYENKRTNMQNSTDRAVLAAAKLQTGDPADRVDPKTIVIDYLSKVGVVIDEDDVTVDEVRAGELVTGRTVSVNLEAAHDTILTWMVGVDTLPFSAMSEAEEGVKDIEVSLVLDVSGSMGSNSKLSRLQTAAKDFNSDILADAADNRVSVSLVPYSTQVSVGEDLLNLLSVTHEHGYSSCVNFHEDSMFENTLINHDEDMKQTASFDPWRSWRYGTGLRNQVCRNEAYMDIVPWSNNVTTLNDQIDDFQAGGNTSIDVAFKWGAALLDPSLNTQLVALEGAGVADIDEEFVVRPHEHDYPDALKFIVVMTDGINTAQYYIKDEFKTGFAHRPGNDTAGYYLRVDDGTVWMKDEEQGDRDNDGRWNEPWYNLSTRTWGDFLDEDDDDEDILFADDFTDGSAGVTVVQKLTWLDFWARITVSRYAYAEYHQTWDADDYYDNRSEPYEYVNASDKDDRLDDVCTAAKTQGIVVFTIGFEVTDDSADVMRDCATTPSQFYRVEGLDIEYAFASIANQINRLKLTQ